MYYRVFAEVIIEFFNEKYTTLMCTHQVNCDRTLTLIVNHLRLDM